MHIQSKAFGVLTKYMIRCIYSRDDVFARWIFCRFTLIFSINSEWYKKSNCISVFISIISFLVFLMKTTVYNHDITKENTFLEILILKFYVSMYVPIQCTKHLKPRVAERKNWDTSQKCNTSTTINFKSLCILKKLIQ